KAAALLDVVEGLQERYTETAKSVSLSYLVSALNILNEAEINFKMARNKRLHVELCIIKLNFLQQAIELAADNKGNIVKKKRVEGPVVYRYRSLPSLQPQPQATPEAKLYIEQPAEKKPQSPPATKPASQPVAPSTTVLRPFGSSSGTKKNLLEVLKEKYGDEYQIDPVKPAELLEMGKLQECWDEYAKRLTSTSAMTFKAAKLSLESETSFAVTVNSLTQQKFIEQERMMLNDHLQTKFSNPIIKFVVKVESGEQPSVPQHMLLNSRQRFEKIASMYPLVKELKEKLKLEIDY
ncbi:MAG TPA: DNA polymerase III subunit gamma/tau, partial [Chitinophagaceae bacterium]